MNEQDNNNPEIKGKQLLVFLQVLNDVTDVIWDKKNYTAPRERFYYSILMKLQFLIDAIQIQVYNLDHKPHYGLAAGLSLRTCMLDVINLYYVMDVHEDIAEATLRINTLMADHLKYVYPSLKDDEKEEARKNWPELFNEQEKLIDFGRITTRDFLKAITHFDTLKTEAYEAMHIYQIFSKYEHNGAFTFDILHNSYSATSNNIIKFMIYSAIGICALACKIIASHWVDDLSPIAVKLNNSIKDLLSFDRVSRSDN